MLREVRAVGQNGVLFALRPRTPEVGRLAKIVIKAAPLNADGLDIDETKAYPITMSRVAVYPIDRAAEPEPMQFTLTPLPEKGAYSLGVVVRKQVDYRVLLSLTLEGGRELKAAFEFSTQPAKAAADSLPGLNAQGHLDMTAQHETMKAMGERWTAAWRDLANESTSWEVVRRNLAEVQTLQKNLPHFELHKFKERKSEFNELSAAFGRDLEVLAEAVGKKDRSASMKRFEHVDRFGCLKCHLVFRWAVVKDFSQVPELNHAK